MVAGVRFFTPCFRPNLLNNMFHCTLSQTTTEKDLGVIANHKLSAPEQVNEARKGALKMLGAINRNVSYRSEQVITKPYCIVPM